MAPLVTLQGLPTTLMAKKEATTIPHHLGVGILVLPLVAVAAAATAAIKVKGKEVTNESFSTLLCLLFVLSKDFFFSKFGQCYFSVCQV